MILKHRDRELLRFEWKGLDGTHVTSVNESELKYLPLEMRGEPTDEALWRWLRHRVVPKHRNYILDMLRNLGIEYNVRSIIEVSKGLSLNDVHWVSQDKSKQTWDKINLYSNPFSKAISVLAFSGVERKASGGTPDIETSPEFTTNGMLAKCWRKKEDGIYLYKSGTEHFANAGFEPYSEYYAAQIAEALGLEHVAYGLEKFKGRLCSTCPLFTSEKYGFVPAGRVVSGDEALRDPRFADVFFFDALIFNTDRHLGNFGYLVDNDTNEIVGAAPIFDNGYGLFSLAVDRPSDPQHHEFDDLCKYVNKVGPTLYTNWCGFPGGITSAMKSKALLLKNFRFTPHPHYNLSDERLQIIESFLQKRALEIAEFGADSDSLLRISQKDVGINHTNSKDDVGINDERSLDIQIMQSMEADPFVTAIELADILQISERTIERRIMAMKQAGEIKRVGSRKNGSWVVLK